MFSFRGPKLRLGGRGFVESFGRFHVQPFQLWNFCVTCIQPIFEMWMFVASNVYDGGAKMPRGGMEVDENCNFQGGIKAVSGHLVFIVFVRHKSNTLNGQHSLYVNASEGQRLNLMPQILWSGAGCAEFECNCTCAGHGNGFGTQRRGEKSHNNSQQFSNQKNIFYLLSFESYFWVYTSILKSQYSFFRLCVVLEVFYIFNIRRIRWDFPWNLFVAGSTTCTVHPLGLSIRVTVAADHGCLARSQGRSFCLVKKLPSYGVEVLLVTVSMISGWKVPYFHVGKNLFKWTGIVSSGRCIANQGRILISFVSTLKRENWRLFDRNRKGT